MEKTMRAELRNAGAETTSVADAYKEIEALIDRTVAELVPLQTGEFGRREVSTIIAVFHRYTAELRAMLAKPELQEPMEEFQAAIEPKLQAIVNRLTSEKGEDENITQEEFANAVQTSSDLTDDEKFVMSVNMKHGKLMYWAELLQHTAHNYDEADRIRDELKK